MSNPQEDELEDILINIEKSVEHSTIARMHGKTGNNRGIHAVALKALRQYAAKARIDEADEALDRFCELSKEHFDVDTATPEARKIYNHVVGRHTERIKQLKGGQV